METEIEQEVWFNVVNSDGCNETIFFKQGDEVLTSIKIVNINIVLYMFLVTLTCKFEYEDRTFKKWAE